MPVSFNDIPSNIRVPLYYVEVNSDKAGLPIVSEKALLVGTMTSTGTAVPSQPVAIGTQETADAAFGQGSELALMFRAFLKSNVVQEVWGLPMPETAGQAATGTLTIGGTPTQAGQLSLYVAGFKLPIPVNTTDTPTTIGDSIAAAVTAEKSLPVTAVNVAGVITFTCKWKGTTGNNVDLRVNYLGAIGGEYMPTGVTVLFAPTANGVCKMAGGTLVPDFDAAIIALGEEAFEFVALPFTDSDSLSAWEVEYGFGDVGRWGWIRQRYGHLFSAHTDTYDNLITFGHTRNSAQLSVMAVEPGSPTPLWEWAAAYCAKAGRALINDPARPLQTLELVGVLPAPPHDRFNIMELNSLAANGMATARPMVGNIVSISRETTTYRLNRYGNSDDAYELVTTLATLAKILRNQRQAITSKYPRHKLANDGTRFGFGQAIVTPKIIKAELVCQYRIDEFNGLVENGDLFKKNLIVERDPNDPNRVNIEYGPDLVNQLRVFAVLAAFRLQYDRGLTTSA